MQRRSGPLSATFVRQVKAPGRYGDGRGSYGLYLRVHASRNGRITKSWGQRLRINGRETSLGLGGYPVVSLKRARDKALANRREVEEGRDPRGGGIPTFAELAEQVIRIHAKTWKRDSGLPSQWKQTFRDYVDPVIGAKRVNTITRADVLAIVRPYWSTRPTAAAKALRRVGTVMKYAVAEGHVPHNVAEPSAIRAALPQANGTRKHHKALPHGEVREALQKVRARRAPDAAKLALEFLVLTAARPGEVRGATWSEIDLEASTWTIPPERMKAKRQHRVPLSGRALEVLEEARGLSDGSGFLFPSPAKTGGPVSLWTLRNALVRNGLESTVHGLRASFRNWAAEVATDCPREVAEAALAHVVKNATEAAYMRSDLLERRREVMEKWADYVA